MTFIDSHLHLTSEAFENDRDIIIESLNNNDVSKVITIGCSLKEISNVVSLARKHSNIYPVVGLYPFDTKDNETILGLSHSEQDYEKLLFKYFESVVHTTPTIVGIGECGLDYSKPAPWERLRTKKEQQLLFEKQIQLSIKANKPIVIHSRGAKEDTLSILENQYKRNQTQAGVWHCFSENLTTAERAIKLGLYISFSGLVTYPKMTDLMTVAKDIPLERILIETDSPFLVPQKGRLLKIKRNEPKYVKMVGAKIAELKGLSLEKVALQTTQNAEILFNI